jgi:hypothetical protein
LSEAAETDREREKTKNRDIVTFATSAASTISTVVAVIPALA